MKTATAKAPTPSTTEPALELRNVKYAAFASDETACFSATLYVDGRKFCGVSNQGTGGPDNFEPLRGGSWADLEAEMLAVALRINPLAIPRYVATTVKAMSDEDFEEAYAGEYWKRGEHTATEIFEGVVGRLLTDHLIGKDLARAFKRKVLFIKPDGKVWERPHRGRVAEAIFAIRKGEPAAVILNDKPLAEAVAIMRARDEK